MKVRTKPRYTNGIKLTDFQFGESVWLYGSLELVSGNGARVLRLWPSGSCFVPPPLGALYRPVLTAVYGDTISVSGLENAGRSWVHQTWYCEVGGRAQVPLPVEAVTMPR